jgi:hypothetical protein
MNSSLFNGSIIAMVAGLIMACGSDNRAAAQTRFRYNGNGQMNSYQSVPRTSYQSRYLLTSPNGQRFATPSNRSYNQVTPGYTVTPSDRFVPGYNSAQNYYSQPYRSGFRGTTTAYPNYNTYPSYSSGYGNTTPGYYPAPGYSSGYRGYVTPSQQRGAAVGGTIGGAIGGYRGGNIGAAIGAAVGQ